MGTRGAWTVKAGGETRSVYNHFDSYPTGLGADLARFIRGSNDVAGDVAALIALTVVDERANPSPDELADLKTRGYWQDVSTGDDWYSALRGAQGDPAAYIQAGYLPAMQGDPLASARDSWLEYIYVIDADAEKLHIYDYDSLVDSIAFDDIRDSDADLDIMMERVEAKVS